MKAIYAATLDAIRAYIAANGYAPTITEIAVALGISHNAARKRVLWLSECGLLVYTPRRLRGIALTNATVYRECKCGRPITDANAVIDFNGRGVYFRRGVCRTCIERRNLRAVRAYRQRNRDRILLCKRESRRQRKLAYFQERIAA